VRKKKRYALFERLPSNLPEDSKFLFQTGEGYVVKLSPKQAEAFREEAKLISGSIRKLKMPKTRK
jgi:hypothetical protein